MNLYYHKINELKLSSQNKFNKLFKKKEQIRLKDKVLRLYKKKTIFLIQKKMPITFYPGQKILYLKVIKNLLIQKSNFNHL